ELRRPRTHSLAGAPSASAAFSTSSSPVQRRFACALGRAGSTGIAASAARLCRKLEATVPDTAVRYEYSPESFTGTEPDYGIEICAAVMEAIEPTPGSPNILNLPATVEMRTPHVYDHVIEHVHRSAPARRSL